MLFYWPVTCLIDGCRNRIQNIQQDMVNKTTHKVNPTCDVYKFGDHP